LEDKVSKAEKSESKPNAFVTRDAAKTIAQCQPDRIGQHDQEVTSEQSRDWIQPREGQQME
jgi:hypothetical protein